jgi:hypothetical protein
LQRIFALKKIISISLLFIFIFQLVGFYLVFKVQKKILKNEIFAFIANNEILLDTDTLLLHISKFEKSKIEENEIRVNNKMYDIIKLEYKSDSVKITCINDSKEEKLFSDFQLLTKHSKNKTDDKKNNTSSLIKILTQLLLCENSYLEFSLENYIISYQFDIVKKYNVFLSFPERPPQVS